MRRWIVAVPLWIAIPIWLLWIGISLFLTACFLFVLAGAGLVYGVGKCLEMWKPGRGAATMATGKVVFTLAADLCDRMNGKQRKPEPVVVHIVEHREP